MAKWMSTDARERVGCPKCEAAAGEYCHTPSGRKASSPHIQRVHALWALPNFKYEDYQVPILTIKDVLKGL